MHNEKETEYIKCYNCGKYITKEDAYKGKYCSLACSTLFSKCRNCTSFFKQKDGFSEFYCSKECAEADKIK
ncbi:MAG: hypothetical protein JXK07_08855 [Spirochaetes bacterium]|nr:hypothetical protein [Spirochaetota bacterium]